MIFGKYIKPPRDGKELCIQKFVKGINFYYYRSKMAICRSKQETYKNKKKGSIKGETLFLRMAKNEG